MTIGKQEEKERRNGETLRNDVRGRRHGLGIG